MTLKELISLKLATVIDVRDPAELAEGIFPGAINIPLKDISSKMEEIRNMKGPLVLYCRSGQRSLMAIQLLKAVGIGTEMHNGGGYHDMLTFLN